MADNQSNDTLVCATRDSCQYFSFKGYQGHCKVVDIYDGDTCTVIFVYSGQFCKYRCRLLGINAPELRQPKRLPAEEREAKRLAAINARNYF